MTFECSAVGKSNLEVLECGALAVGKVEHNLVRIAGHSKVETRSTRVRSEDETIAV